MELVVARFLPTGELDGAFGSGGIVRTSIAETDSRLSMTVRLDELRRINVVAGRDALTIARYLDTGEPDATFGQGGIVTSSFFPDVDSFSQTFVRGVMIDDRPPIVDPDSSAAPSPFPRRIIAAGAVRVGPESRFRIGVARYDSGGLLDPTFGDGGEVLSELPAGDVLRTFADSVCIDAEGRIVVGGGAGDADFNNDRFVILRYLPDGSQDTSFNDGGAVLTSFGDGRCVVREVTIAGGQKIVALGLFEPAIASPSWEFALARYLPDGKLDPTFGDDGRIRTTFDGEVSSAFCVTLDHKSRIVAAGKRGSDFPDGRFAIARYLPSDGSLDTTFGDSGRVTVDFNNPFTEALAVVADLNDRLIVAGHANFRLALARLREDGNLDSTFGRDGRVRLGLIEGQNSAAHAITLDEKERIIIAGVAVPPGEEPKMPKVTAFVAIQDGNVVIGKGEPSNDIHFAPFDLPGLSGAGILLFRLRALGQSKFQVAFNNASTLEVTLDTEQSRSFHEIYPLSTLREELNDLSMAVTPVSGVELGRAVISDVVVLYGATPNLSARLT